MEFKPIKTLNTEEALKLIEGQEDLISKDYNAESKYFSTLQCINCGGKVEKQLMGKEFRGFLPKNYAKCQLCNCTFDPYSGLIIG